MEGYVLSYMDYDFKVSPKRKGVWNAEIEMLEIVKSICDKAGLQYFAIAGTLLGAIRHGGFIPWDDDLDVAMFREDYDRFIEIAQKNMPDGYFLQTPETDDDYFFGHAKIRKKNTTAIRYIQYPERYSHHQGVFIDIFPLDNIPVGKFAYKFHRFVALKMMQIIYYAKYYYRLNEHATITKIKHKICTILLPNNKAVAKAFRIYEKWILLPKGKTKMIGFSSTFYHKDNAFSWERVWFSETENIPFEDTNISVPIEYDKILTKNYGDYMRPIIGTSQHGSVFYDLQHDYKAYYDGTLTFSKDDLIL